MSKTRSWSRINWAHTPQISVSELFWLLGDARTATRYRYMCVSKSWESKTATRTSSVAPRSLTASASPIQWARRWRDNWLTKSETDKLADTFFWLSIGSRLKGGLGRAISYTVFCVDNRSEISVAQWSRDRRIDVCWIFDQHGASMGLWCRPHDVVPPIWSSCSLLLAACLLAAAFVSHSKCN